MKGKLQNVKFYKILLHKKHPFYNGNRRISKILFANIDEISNILMRQKYLKNRNIRFKCSKFTKKITILKYKMKQMVKSILILVVLPGVLKSLILLIKNN